MSDPTPVRQEITDLLQEAARPDGGDEAHERLYEAVYPELRRMAAGLMRRERPDHTLQATALVNEAYIQLVDRARVEWDGRAHFFGAAARAMRRILVDHARRRRADRRGGGARRITLDEAQLPGAGSDEGLLTINDALERLAAFDPRGARIVELRVFGGLSVPEAAQLLGVSKRTVDGDWAVAKRYLARALTDQARP
jgi:RNA polymerase sigma-70 factor (ECF subfamily)